MINLFDHVPRETIALLHELLKLVEEENRRQNLVSSTTLNDAWVRHVSDSAQLPQYMPPTTRTWVDVGSGAGFPGLVVAIMTTVQVTLVEPRAKRAAFLARAAAALSLKNVTVLSQTVAKVELSVDVISARAVAPLPDLIGMTIHLAHSGTTWLLPKGRRWREELAAARETWHGLFRALPSITSEDAAVIVASDIRKRAAP